VQFAGIVCAVFERTDVCRELTAVITLQGAVSGSGKTGTASFGALCILSVGVFS
jgi:hypothetical protein